MAYEAPPTFASQALGGLGGEETCGFAYKHPEVPPSAGPLTAEDRKAIALVTELFREHIDTVALLGATPCGPRTSLKSCVPAVMDSEHVGTRCPPPFACGSPCVWTLSLRRRSPFAADLEEATKLPGKWVRHESLYPIEG